MSVFVTVGSTRFDDLVREVVSENVLRLLGEQGYSQLTIQHGASPVRALSSPIKVNAFDYALDLMPFIREAHLVVTHAGSGTLLDIYRGCANPPRVIVVTNDGLMDDHQQELAMALAQRGVCDVCRVRNLGESIAKRRVESSTLPERSKEPVLERLLTSLLQ